MPHIPSPSHPTAEAVRIMSPLTTSGGPNTTAGFGAGPLNAAAESLVNPPFSGNKTHSTQTEFLDPKDPGTLNASGVPGHQDTLNAKAEFLVHNAVTGSTFKRKELSQRLMKIKSTLTPDGGVLPTNTCVFHIAVI